MKLKRPYRENQPFFVGFNPRTGARRIPLNLNLIMRSATLVYRVFAAYYRPVPRNSASARDLSALRPCARVHARARATVITFTYCRLTTYHVGSWDPRLLHRTQRQIRAQGDREAGLRESRGEKERRDEKEGDGERSTEERAIR